VREVGGRLEVEELGVERAELLSHAWSLPRKSGVGPSPAIKGVTRAVTAPA
jgi:hypothetical protein